MRRRPAAGRVAVLAAALALPLVGVPPGVHAQARYQYPDADLALGDKLLREHDCTFCHARKVGGDGSAIYRPRGRINTPSALVTMVERCSTELNLQLFPEDTLAIAAVLQRDHYRFPAATPPAKP